MADSLERRAQVLMDSDERAAAELELDLQQSVARLAALPPLNYDRERNQEADRLGVRLATLDQEVERHRQANRTADDNDGAIFRPVVPWPEPVDGGTVLDAVATTFDRYIVLAEHAATVLALWSAHTHCLGAFLHSPRLNVFSPEKGCGKTLVLDVLSVLTPRSLRTENVSTAALFRIISKEHPTLLIDEADTFLHDNEELRGALNAGHKRGGVHLRCEGDDHSVRAFNTFGASALSGIGSLHGTLADRSIPVRMKRARPGETRERFDSRKTVAEQELCRKLARWADDHAVGLVDADPYMPNGIHNRKADNWRPLLAIADRLGGDWPKRAREAAVALAEDESDSIRVQLLEDIRRVFEQANSDRLMTVELLNELVKMEDRPWSDWAHGKPLNPRQLATHLKPFGILPRSVRPPDSGKTGKGYVLEQFIDAFSRYLTPRPGMGQEIRHTGTTHENMGFGDIAVRHKSGPLSGTIPESATYPAQTGDWVPVPECVPGKKFLKPLENVVCAGVPDILPAAGEGGSWVDPLASPARHISCLRCRYWVDQSCEENIAVTDPAINRLCVWFRDR